MDPTPSERAPSQTSLVFEPMIADASACAVKLEVFEGPLDLLLHLIRLNEVDITDIPIAEIAEQYLEYVELMRELDIDIAGEYLLMAATLAWIKSRFLLPRDEEAEEEEGDPRAELVARLLEYQRFKEAAGELGERVRLGRDVFSSAGEEPERPSAGEREIEVGVLELLEALRHVLQAAREAGATHLVEHESISVRDRMIAVMEILASAEPVEFGEIFRDASGGYASRTMIVATFLAILELARLAALRIYQSLDGDGAPDGPIRLRRAAESDPHLAERIAQGL